MTDEGLKPCPFCGCTDTTFEYFRSMRWYYLACEQCEVGLIVDYPPDDVRTPDEAKAEAHRRWNTRTAVEVTP